MTESRIVRTRQKSVLHAIEITQKQIQRKLKQQKSTENTIQAYKTVKPSLCNESRTETEFIEPSGYCDKSNDQKRIERIRRCARALALKPETAVPGIPGQWGTSFGRRLSIYRQN